jgi:hypothetical protein
VSTEVSALAGGRGREAGGENNDDDETQTTIMMRRTMRMTVTIGPAFLNARAFILLESVTLFFYHEILWRVQFARGLLQRGGQLLLSSLPCGWGAPLNMSL